MRDTMAGSEIQEPFSLSFQGSSVHSGSISFGRFEEEGLSWEKRSSFSHNRYLEEVDKCSKPGSVTEMKAHFEAHFKKRGMRVPDSLESQTWGVHQKTEPDDNDDATESFEDYRSDESFSENTSQSESPCNYQREQEKIQCEYVEESDHCVSYDEIVVNSDDVIELDEEGGGVDHLTLDVSLDNDEVVPVECISIEEDRCEDLGEQETPVEIEVQDDDQDKKHCAKVQETGSRLVEHVPEKASGVIERPSSACGPKSLPNAKPISPKAVSVNKASTKRHDVTPKATSGRTKDSSVKANSKTKVDAKSQKELRPKKAIESRPSTSKKIETRTPLGTNRPKTGSHSAKPEMSTCATSFRFKCSERAEKRKEFYTKLEEKIHAKKTETNKVQAKTQQKAEAEMKQFRKSLNFKATPMPSFYNTITRPVSRNKTEPSKVAPSRPRSTTSASSTNRALSRVGGDKVMVGNRKQSASKESGLQKGNFMAVETKQKVGSRKSGN
ncbi:Protein WVD2-like 7 [Hirschfeldia incana]|nr:Protein WVD2-like 7 [Hirschfeldia incana]